MPNVERRLKLATIALVFVGFFALTSTFRYSTSALMVPLMAVAFMPLGEWLDRKFVAYRQFTSALILLYMFSLPFIVRSYHLLDVVISLVIFIQVYSLLHLKRERNYGHIFLMSFFMVLAASVLSPRAGIALVFIAFIVFAAWGLSLLEMYAAQTRDRRTPGRPIRFENMAGQNEAGAFGRALDFGSSAILIPAVAILGFTVVLFYFTPRTEAGLLGRSDASTRFIMGQSPKVDLTAGGFLGGGGGPVMRVQFPQEPNGMYDGPKFWRSTALDSYTGSSWERRGLITRTPPRNVKIRRFKSDYRLASNEGLDRGSFELGRQVYQEIFLDSPPDMGIPALQMVKMILPGENSPELKFRWDVASDFTVNLGDSAKNGMSIRVWSEAGELDPALLRASSEDYRSVMVESDVRNLTYHNLLPKTQELVHELTDEAPTVYDKVEALTNWLLLGGGFTYSLDIPFLPPDNPIDAFIHEEKSGHCELYASALALMVRSLGVPARVVSGYRGGEWDEADQSYTVTNDMAHLWTEIYFPDVGWVPFDPSPPSTSPPPFSLDSLARVYSRYMLRARLLWLSNVVSFSPDEDQVMFRDLALKAFSSMGDRFEPSGIPETEVTLLQKIRRPLASGVAILAISFLAYVLVRRMRNTGKPRHVLTADQQRAVRLHGLIMRRLRRLGFDGRGMTAEEVGEALAEVGLENRDSALHLLDAYNATRFGMRGLSVERFKEHRQRVRALKPATE